MNNLIQLLKDLVNNNPVGNPFSAAILNIKTGKSYCAVNEVYSGDPTAHAEIVAIRNLKKTGYNPEDCIIISSGAPCPMCLAAIAWAGIKEVRYIYSYRVAYYQGFPFDQDCHRVNKLLGLGLNIKQIDE